MENNPIPLKTSDPDFNRFDFIQTDCGLMVELTVKITLAEYRELVTQLATEKQEAIRFMFERDRARKDLEKMEIELTTEKGLREEATEKVNDLAKEITGLHGEVERQRKTIAYLKTRLSDEIRHQNYLKEDGNAEG